MGFTTMKKHAVALLLSAFMILGLLPLGAFATGAAVNENPAAEQEAYAITQLYTDVRTIKGTGVSGNYGILTITQHSIYERARETFEVVDGAWSVYVDYRMGNSSTEVKVEFYEDDTFETLLYTLTETKIPSVSTTNGISNIANTFPGRTGTLGYYWDFGSTIYAFREEPEISILYDVTQRNEMVFSLRDAENNVIILDTFPENKFGDVAVVLMHGASENARSAGAGSNFNPDEIHKLSDAPESLKSRIITQIESHNRYPQNDINYDEVGYFIISQEDIIEHDLYLGSFPFDYEVVYNTNEDGAFLFDTAPFILDVNISQYASVRTEGYSGGDSYIVQEPMLGLTLTQAFAVNGGALRNGMVQVQDGDTVTVEITLTSDSDVVLEDAFLQCTLFSGNIGNIEVNGRPAALEADGTLKLDYFDAVSSNWSGENFLLADDHGVDNAFRTQTVKFDVVVSEDDLDENGILRNEAVAEAMTPKFSYSFSTSGYPFAGDELSVRKEVRAMNAI